MGSVQLVWRSYFRPHGTKLDGACSFRGRSSAHDGMGKVGRATCPLRSGGIEVGKAIRDRSMLQRLTKVFTELGVDYEIIFVNDRSPTQDEAVIRALCEEDAHVVGISHSRNFGSQGAFLSGMETSTGDAVILLDGDLQDTPE